MKLIPQSSVTRPGENSYHLNAFRLCKTHVLRSIQMNSRSAIHNHRLKDYLKSTNKGSQKNLASDFRNIHNKAIVMI